MNLKTQGIMHFRAILTWIIAYVAFTVTYAILWLEVLLHYFAVKVFHIRCVTRGGENGEANPTHFLEIQKMLWFWEKKGPDFVHPEVEFIIQNIVLRVP